MIDSMGEQQFEQFMKTLDEFGVSGGFDNRCVVQDYDVNCLAGNCDIAHTDTNTEADQMHPLVLAYIGDSVYELFVRTRLLGFIKTNVNRIHRAAIDYVRLRLPGH